MSQSQFSFFDTSNRLQQHRAMAALLITFGADASIDCAAILHLNGKIPPSNNPVADLNEAEMTIYRQLHDERIAQSSLF